jgi:hypothetical protein
MVEQEDGSIDIPEAGVILSSIMLALVKVV